MFNDLDWSQAIICSFHSGMIAFSRSRMVPEALPTVSNTYAARLARNLYKFYLFIRASYAAAIAHHVLRGIHEHVSVHAQHVRFGLG